MKVSMISVLPPVRGGISRYTFDLCKELGKDIEIDFFGFVKPYPKLLYPGKGIFDNENNKMRIKGVKWKGKLNWYNIFGWIKSGFGINTDLLHVQWWTSFFSVHMFVILSIAKMRGIKVLFTVHNTKMHEASLLNRSLQKAVLNFGDGFIVHSERNKETLSRRFGINHSKISVVHHGVRKRKEHGMTKKDARNSISIKKDEKVILYFGFIRDYKGVDILIKAFKEIEGSCNRLIIAGECWEDEKKYKALIGDDSRIIFINRFIDSEYVERLFLCCDLAVLPYKFFDSASGVGGMALEFGRPLIVTDVGSLPEIVSDKEVCVARPDDVNDLRKKIMQVIRDKGLMDRLVKDSMRMRDLFSWENIGLATIDVYKRFSGEVNHNDQENSAKSLCD